MVEEQPSGNGNGTPDLRALEQTLGEIRSLETAILLDRLRWAREHGVTFDGKRKEYEIFGYDVTITYKQYRDEYARGGIAGRVVDVMPDACWRGEPAFEIIEDEDPEKDTEFEKVWKELSTKHGVTAKLIRADRLSRLSTYAVLLIGAPGTLDEELPHVKGPDALLYLKPFSGGGGPGNNNERTTIDSGALATVHEYEDDPKNKRFGLPRLYKLKQVAGSIVNLPYVHWSRVIHVAEGLLEDDVFGQPALERVWNLLADLRKVTGGGAEAFWLRANQGLHLDIDKDMALDSTKDTIEKLKEQADAYKHQLDRWIRTRGVKVETLGSDVANFSNPADAIITQIAGSKAIPKRILTGSEMGELASSQDRENFKDQVNGRQTQHLGPNIVRQLVDRLIEYGFLPAPSKGEREYQVKWPHIQVLTEDEKAKGSQSWAQTKVAEDPVFTSAEIRDKWYGMQPLTAEQMKEIDDRKAEAVKRQQASMGEPQPPGFPRAAEFDESRHPRDPSGKFTDGSGDDPAVKSAKEKLGDRSESADTWIKATLDEDETYFDRKSAAQVKSEYRRWKEDSGGGGDKVESVKAKLGDRSEDAETWINATLDEDELHFDGKSPAQIRSEYRRWKKSLRSSAAGDEELVRVLAAAIESGATEVIEAICGMPRTLAFDPGQPRDDEGQWTDGGSSIKAAVDSAVAPLKQAGYKKFDVNVIPVDSPDAGSNDAYWSLAELKRKGEPGKTYLINAYRRQQGQWTRGTQDVTVTLPKERK